MPFSLPPQPSPQMLPSEEDLSPLLAALLQSPKIAAMLANQNVQGPPLQIPTEQMNDAPTPPTLGPPGPRPARTLPDGNLQVNMPQYAATGARTPPFVPQQGQSGPGLWSRVKAGLPGLMRGAMAGGAMPSVAGGGALDIFRAAQAGDEAVLKRDLVRWNQAQQAQRATLERAKAQADIAQSQAAEGMYGAHQKLYEEQAKPKPGFEEKYKALTAMGIPENEARVIASGGVLQHQKPADPYADMIEVTPEAGERYGVAKGADGRYRIPRSALRPVEQPSQGKPTAAAALQETAQARATLADQLGLKGGDRQSYILTGRIENRSAGGGDDKVEKRQQKTALIALDEWKANKELDAESNRRKAIRDAQNAGFGQSGQLNEAQKEQIENDYNVEMTMVQRAYEQRKATIGGGGAQPRFNPNTRGVSVKGTSAGATAKPAPKAWEVLNLR